MVRLTFFTLRRLFSSQRLQTKLKPLINLAYLSSARFSSAMQVARKIPTDDPEVLFYLRIVYVAVRSSHLPIFQPLHVQSTAIPSILTPRHPTRYHRGRYYRYLLLHVQQGKPSSPSPSRRPTLHCRLAIISSGLSFLRPSAAGYPRSLCHFLFYSHRSSKRMTRPSSSLSLRRRLS